MEKEKKKSVLRIQMLFQDLLSACSSDTEAQNIQMGVIGKHPSKTGLDHYFYKWYYVWE